MEFCWLCKMRLIAALTAYAHWDRNEESETFDLKIMFLREIPLFSDTGIDSENLLMIRNKFFCDCPFAYRFTLKLVIPTEMEINAFLKTKRREKKYFIHLCVGANYFCIKMNIFILNYTHCYFQIIFFFFSQSHMSTRNISVNAHIS